MSIEQPPRNPAVETPGLDQIDPYVEPEAPREPGIPVSKDSGIGRVVPANSYEMSEMGERDPELRFEKIKDGIRSILEEQNISPLDALGRQDFFVKELRKKNILSANALNFQGTPAEVALAARAVAKEYIETQEGRHTSKVGKPQVGLGDIGEQESRKAG